MKRFFLLLAGAMFMSAGFAQVVEEGEAALVYYSPKTTLSLDFVYTVETRERGLYSDFAEAMLGIDDAVTENQTTYTLRDVRIGTRTGTDYSRPHQITYEPCVPLLLRINEKGLLTGYNVPVETASQEKRSDKTSTQKSDKKQPSKHIAPYPEEVLEAATPLAQANALAKQIFRLRETRMYLLSGEVEHAPADGQAMKLVLDELDKQERELTELFVGKTIKRTEHKIVRWTPEEKDRLLFFSEENGFTAADNIDADTIRVSVALHPQQYKAPSDSKKKKSAPMSQIVYNLPGSGDVTVRYDGRVLGQRTVPIAQLGVDVPLSKEVFAGQTLPVIIFNEKTGNIESISK
jgi:hypothetical protein